jgi:Uma2 family endonuclease
MPDTSPFVTAEQLERFPDDDYRYELVAGRVVRMSPVAHQHGRIVMRVGYLLSRHLDGRHLGVVSTEVGFKLASNPDTVRAPDVAFLCQERIPRPEPRGFMDGPPDLAIEVLSPGDSPSEVAAKVEEYLVAGVRVVVVVDPDARVVRAIRPSLESVTLQADRDVLDLQDVIVGFRCTLREVFE